MESPKFVYVPDSKVPLPPMDPALRKAIRAANAAGRSTPVTLRPYDLPSPERSLSNIPGKFFRRMSIKIFIIGALVWDYTETVLDIAAQMRIDHGIRKVSRAIRETRRDYDQMCRRHIDLEHMERICDLSLLFERINKERLTKLNYGLINEIHKHDCELDRDYIMLLDAVLTALTVLDALQLFAAECDEKIAKVYPHAPHSCLPDHFQRLAVLLPQYAGDHYFVDSESRRITAKALLNEINTIELYDDNGKV